MGGGRSAAPGSIRVPAAIVEMLAAGGYDPGAHLELGVVLQPGEMPSGPSPGSSGHVGDRAAQVAAGRVRWGGRRVNSTAREVTASGWQDRGEIDWLITSLRLVGRTHADGELVSIWWSGLASAQVDLAGDAVHLDRSNGWQGQLTGPGVAPIAVAAVAACYGPDALPDHPGLGRLRRTTAHTETPPAPEPLALGPGDPLADLRENRRLS